MMVHIREVITLAGDVTHCCLMQFTHVLFKVKVTTETFTAHLARKGFLIIVCMHMKSKIINLVKCFGTNRAFIRFFSTVGQFVILVVAFLVEAFPAVLADEGLVPGVNPRVRVQRR